MSLWTKQQFPGTSHEKNEIPNDELASGHLLKAVTVTYSMMRQLCSLLCLFLPQFLTLVCAYFYIFGLNQLFR